MQLNLSLASNKYIYLQILLVCVEFSHFLRDSANPPPIVSDEAPWGITKAGHSGTQLLGKIACSEYISAVR